MKDEYTHTFYKILKTTQEQYNCTVPDDVEAYLVILLSSFVERSDVPREEPFAIAFLQLDSKPASYAKELGDDCLFITSMFPSYMTSRGMSANYLSDIGATSYGVAAERMNNSMFDTISREFDLCRSILCKTADDPVTRLLNR